MCNKFLTAFLLTVSVIVATAYKPFTIQSDKYQTRAKSFRYYNKNAYQILDSNGFYLYYRYVQEAYTRGKGEVKMDKYFFSRDGNSSIQLLTRENLKGAFPDNNRFHYAIDGQFRTDKELIGYDPYNKCYKVTYLYSQSLK